MRKYQNQLILVFALCMLGNSWIAAANSSDTNTCNLEELSVEYRNLRTIPGHFGGGSWSDDADRWNGRKQQVMNLLGDCLGTGRYSKSEIIQWMGNPDRIAVKGDYYFAAIEHDRRNKPSGDYQYLIYFWRGGHDFLYFTFRGETIIDSGWWMAGE
ncbi:hypothetical protein ACE1CD_01535 [Aerosakkonema sp. BLCC-F183]|uniref:hypothetical protein n=1 Tax=Aerosakkonema sp. BLCC-F183 TaxID=3342834 RepID=UPI0035B72230